MMAFSKLSDSVYMRMCQDIGTLQQVTSRRDITDMLELLDDIQKYDKVRSMRTGSYKEGFRLQVRGSDVDSMFWPTDHRVIWNFSQTLYYNVHIKAMILCESSESPPGYTLLWLPYEGADTRVLSSCVRMNGVLYISSSKYRDIAHPSMTCDAIAHGPCRSGTVDGVIDYDIAHGFVSDFWPPSAYSWIDRCHSWPLPHVVNDIVRNGCHFVAIGNKQGNHADNEWRISFSQAEYKLVCSMNHTQFLTYGLLKLFLNEIINNGLRNEDKLLCSYHMKTAVFWAIQQDTLPHWCPQNLLAGFWLCFKLLLKWVYEGICPNFFIPANNMFLSKIHGEAQTTLYSRLYGLYEKGIALLLQSPSIRSSIIYVLCNPGLAVCTDEHTLISEAGFDVELFCEINRSDGQYKKDLQHCMKTLRIIEKQIALPLSQCQVVMLQKYTATTFLYTSAMLNNMCTNTRVNKQVYISSKMVSHMLKLAAKFGCVSDILYIAMYYYNTLKYREALSIIEMTKVKLAQPYLMYNEHVDRERYTEAVGRQSLSTKMRRAVIMDIRHRNGMFLINELMPEQWSSGQNRHPFLLIPPYVLLHMLEFLCSRHVDTVRAQTALNELQVLVHYDQGHLVPDYNRDISWEILGICQQITGNLQAALQSYKQSLRQYSFNEIHTATIHRIRDIHL
eukprot:XP_011415895.1 PREDICTED: uncharacterized protein LOC105319870 [Crassostrea gigas]